MEKTLTSRQFSVLAFTAAIAVKMFMLPSLLVAEAGRNGYIWMLVYVVIDLAALALIAVAAVKAKRSFYELTESVLSRIGARVLLVLCAAYILFKMTLMLSEVNVFFSEAMYENFSWPVYLIPLLAVLAYAAARSPRVVAAPCSCLRCGWATFRRWPSLSAKSSEKNARAPNSCWQVWPRGLRSSRLP